MENFILKPETRVGNKPSDGFEHVAHQNRLEGGQHSIDAGGDAGDAIEGFGFRVREVEEVRETGRRRFVWGEGVSRRGTRIVGEEQMIM